MLIMIWAFTTLKIPWYKTPMDFSLLTHLRTRLLLQASLLASLLSLQASLLLKQASLHLQRPP